MKETISPVEDRIDRRILRILASDGRKSVQDIASATNISTATCHRRIQRLIKSGAISAFRADIAPAAVGLSTLVMVGVVLDRSTPESFAAFEGAVMALKQVLDCNLVAGDFDYLLKIRVRDIADFNALHAAQLLTLPGVRQTRTFFVMKEVKENAPLSF